MTASENIPPLLPSLLQPDNHNKKYESLFNEIDTGQIKLPMFQREFVWEKEQSARLIDSILKGYPIGTFIFWKTREELRSYKDIGNHSLPETPKGDYSQYILDGQQRITSLYAIRKGIRISKDGAIIDYKDIYVDLLQAPNTDEQVVLTTIDGEPGRYISVHRLLTSQITDLFDEYDKNALRTIETSKSKLVNYDFSTITIKDYPIEIACEVFTRINTGGKALTIFEIMVAKTYDEARGFDLAERYQALRDGDDLQPKCLADAKFETLSESIILQCVAALAARAVRGKEILRIRKSVFIDSWEAMNESLFMAIDFVRSQIGVTVSQLLPYPALLVPLTHFFNTTKNKKPNSTQAKLLEQFFYWVSLTERYSSSSDSKIAEDFSKIDSICAGTAPNYPPNELQVDPEDIAATRFSTGNAYCKAILCLLSWKGPRSFDHDAQVLLDNSNLKIASSRNYHHFFPKHYLSKKNFDHDYNLISNITLIDGYLNKHCIGKRAPSVYIDKLTKGNPDIIDTLSTHLIPEASFFAIESDDYDAFIAIRSSAIALELMIKLGSVSRAQAQKRLAKLIRETEEQRS